MLHSSGWQIHQAQGLLHVCVQSPGTLSLDHQLQAESDGESRSADSAKSVIYPKPFGFLGIGGRWSSGPPAGLRAVPCASTLVQNQMSTEKMHKVQACRVLPCGVSIPSFKSPHSGARTRHGRSLMTQAQEFFTLCLPRDQSCNERQVLSGHYLSTHS